ncbi:MAG: IS4 family transposase [Gemmataceae bacterium]
MVQLTNLAAELQDLFTATAAFFAAWVGLVRRKRQLTGPALAQALVFHWMAYPKATLADIACGLGVSEQALRQRLGPRAQPFFRALIADALRRLANARFAAHTLGLLRAFPAVVVEDCTTVSLPAALAGLFPGCGGAQPGHGAAAVKILARYELRTGKLLALSFHPGRTRDVDLAARPADLPRGGLYLADLGFFGAARLARVGTRCHWITRIPVSTSIRSGGGVWLPLADWLRGQRADVVDGPGDLAKSVGTPCRLVALRCPRAVAAQRRRQLRTRRRRKEGKEPTAGQLACCDWVVLATSVPAAVLGPREVWIAYRCRWQVELLFKRCKGLAGWSFTHGVKGDRVLAELLAKVLGLIVLHWATLLAGPALAGTSATRQMRVVAGYARDLGRTLGRGSGLGAVLQEMLDEMTRIKPRRSRRRKPNTRDLLLDPGLATPAA